MTRQRLTGHRAVDDGTMHCGVCRVTLVDFGRGAQHQQGWAGRQERVRLGLPVRDGVPKPGSRASVVAEQRDRIAILERENEALRLRIEAMERVARGVAVVTRMETLANRLDGATSRLEALGKRPQNEHRNQRHADAVRTRA